MHVVLFVVQRRVELFHGERQRQVATLHQRRDSELMRPGKPFVFTNCMTGEGIKELVTLIRDMALFDRVSEKEVEEMKV